MMIYLNWKLGDEEQNYRNIRGRIKIRKPKAKEESKMKEWPIDKYE